MENKLRNSNIEILRILCMLFIIGGHVIMNYKNDELGTLEYYISNILRSFFIVAVNCYVIISGYFSIKLNIKKLLKMSMQISFYSIVIYLIMVLINVHVVDVKRDLLMLFPIITKRYWYITTYFVLCIISPVLNILIERLSKKQFKVMLIVGFIIFYCLPTICYVINAPTVTADSGYGIVNFICLYLLGRYIKLYFYDNKSWRFYSLAFIVVSLSLFLANHMLTVIFGFYFNSFISYDTIFVLLASFMLFMIFKNINIRSKLINILAKYSLVAYIIHMHPILTSYLFNNIFNISKYYGIEYLMEILLIPIIIYTSSCIIELVRILIFDKIENHIIDKIFNSKFYKNNFMELYNV